MNKYSNIVPSSDHSGAVFGPTANIHPILHLCGRYSETPVYCRSINLLILMYDVNWLMDIVCLLLYLNVHACKCAWYFLTAVVAILCSAANSSLLLSRRMSIPSNRISITLNTLLLYIIFIVMVIVVFVHFYPLSSDQITVAIECSEL